MRVLVAFECSGIVRDAFIARGHTALSVDLEPSELPGPHYQGDVYDVLENGWDMMICHPPCTHLSVSGARWFKEKASVQPAAIELVQMLLNAPIRRIALENPISIISTKIRKPEQIIQPWQFGHPETKATCLWLKNLPPLVPTSHIVDRVDRVHHLGPSEARAMERSRTFPGIAAAMADQWGKVA
jgi:hypothetical protein